MGRGQPPAEVTPSTLAWAAGVLDACAVARIRERPGRGRSPWLRVAAHRAGPVIRLRDLFGGGHMRLDRGRALHELTWEGTGKVPRVLQAVRPYLTDLGPAADELLGIFPWPVEQAVEPCQWHNCPRAATARSTCRAHYALITRLYNSTHIAGPERGHGSDAGSVAENDARDQFWAWVLGLTARGSDRRRIRLIVSLTGGDASQVDLEHDGPPVNVSAAAARSRRRA